MIAEQPTIHMRDLTLAVNGLLAMVEWLLIRDKKRLGPHDVSTLLKEIDLYRALLSEEEAHE